MYDSVRWGNLHIIACAKMYPATPIMFCIEYSIFHIDRLCMHAQSNII